MLKFLNSIFKQEDSKEENQATLDGISNQTQTLTKDSQQTKIEYVILTSSGLWLDAWGAWFGVPRVPNESDALYSARILALATRPKSTRPAIIKAINEVAGYTGNLTFIYEPYGYIAKHSISKFSGLHRYEEGNYWLPAVIDIYAPYPISDRIRNTVLDVKAAGVRVYYTHNNQIQIPIGSRFYDKFIPTSNNIISMGKFAQTASGVGYDTSRGAFSTSKKTRSGKLMFVQVSVDKGYTVGFPVFVYPNPSGKGSYMVSLGLQGSFFITPTTTRESLTRFIQFKSTPTGTQILYVSPTIRLDMISNDMKRVLNANEKYAFFNRDYQITDWLYTNPADPSGYSESYNIQTLIDYGITIQAPLTINVIKNWAASTAYVLNANVAPVADNGFYYTCTVAGTSAAAQPTWPTTDGATVTDGTITWKAMNKLRH